MGLRKLTQWEETVAKQEQKRFWLMNIAIVCVIVMCAVLWLVQDKLYGDVVRTGAAVYFGAFTGAGIGRTLRSRKEKESAEKQKRNGKILVWILFLLVIGGAIFLKEFRLTAVQLLFSGIPVLWFFRIQKADCDENCLENCEVILMTVMILVGTFVGVKLMGLTTLPTVEKKIAAEGFTEIEYNTWMYDRWLNLDENNEKKYYVFQAKKDGQNWQIAADPKGGQLVQRRRIDAPCRNRKLCVK